MEKWIQILREKGYKITPQRRAIVEAMFRRQPFLTVQQVLIIVKKEYPDVSLDTIYRTLSLLVELGLVYEIHMQNGEGNLYEIAHKAHHHHLVCVECGKAECIDVCPIQWTDLTEIRKKGFEVTGHIFEIYGCCKACKEKPMRGK